LKKQLIPLVRFLRFAQLEVWFKFHFLYETFFCFISGTAFTYLRKAKLFQSLVADETAGSGFCPTKWTGGIGAPLYFYNKANLSACWRVPLWYWSVFAKAKAALTQLQPSVVNARFASNYPNWLQYISSNIRSENLFVYQTKIFSRWFSLFSSHTYILIKQRENASRSPSGLDELTLTYFGFVQCPLQSLDFFTVFATQCRDVFSKLNTEKDIKMSLS